MRSATSTHLIFALAMALAALVVVGAGPAQAVDYLAVVNHVGQSVHIFDPATPHTALNNTSMVGLNYPLYAEFGPNGNLFVGIYSDKTVRQYAKDTWAYQGVYADTLPGPAMGQAGLAFGHDGNLYLGADAKYAYVYEEGLGTSQFPLDLFYAIRGVATAPDGYVYFASQAGLTPSQDDGVIHCYNPATDKWLGTAWVVPGDPGGIAFGPDASGDGYSDLYLTDWYGGVFVINGRTGAFISTVVADSTGTADVVWSSDGSTMYFSNQLSHKVYKYTGGVKTVYADGNDGINGPQGLALSNEYAATVGSQDYLIALGFKSNGFSSSTVSIFDPALPQRMLDNKTISVNNPLYATFGGPNGNLFVGSYSDMNVQQYQKGSWASQGIFCSLPLGTPPDLPASGLAGLHFASDGKLYMGADAKYSFSYDGVSTQYIKDMNFYTIRGVTAGADGIVYFASETGLSADPGDGVILRLNTANGQWLADWVVPADPRGITMGPDYNDNGASDLYIADGRGGVLVVDSVSGLSLGTFVADNPGTSDLVFSGDGNTLYFSNANDLVVNQYKAGVKTVYASAPDAPVLALYGLALSDAYVPVVGAPAIPVAFVKDAKKLADGTRIIINGKIATTSDSDLPGYFYIEETDRSSGIRVTPVIGGLTRGSVVDVEGTMGTTLDGERQIENATVTIQTQGTPASEIKPLGMTNAVLGGGDFETPPEGQYGVANSNGLNNVGLLVKVWGNITGTEGSYLLIDDGSGVTVRVDTTALSNPPTSGYVSVTGISSLSKPSADRLRVLLAIAVQPIP